MDCVTLRTPACVFSPISLSILILQVQYLFSPRMELFLKITMASTCTFFFVWLDVHRLVHYTMKKRIALFV